MKKFLILALLVVFSAGYAEGKEEGGYTSMVTGTIYKGAKITKDGVVAATGYSLKAGKYGLEKGKDGLWYLTGTSKYYLAPILSATTEYAGALVNLPTMLPALSQTQWLSYLEGLTSSTATRFDKALDAKYLETAMGGGNHRLFDGGHTLGGAWKNVSEMCAATGCSSKEQVSGYFGALWKDATTPKGLPFMTMEKQTYDALANRLSDYGISKQWTYDALSYDALEVVGAGISAAVVVYHLNAGQTEELSEALGAIGIASIASANPLMALVAISSVAYAIATGTDLKGTAVASGMVKTAIVSGALVLVPGPFVMGLTGGVALSILFDKSVNYKNYEIAKDYVLYSASALKAWIPT